MPRPGIGLTADRQPADPTLSDRRTGRCPTVASPVEQRDGFLVRIGLVGGCVTPAQAAAVAAIAAEHGSGVIELTSRANLQVRGVVASGLEAVGRRIEAIGLGDPRERLVTVSSFSGLDPAEATDPRPLRSAALAVLGRLEHARLAPKFHVAIETGSTWPSPRGAADVALVVTSDRSARIELGGRIAIRMAMHEIGDVVNVVAQRCIDRGAQARVRDLIDDDGGATLIALVSDRIGREVHIEAVDSGAAAPAMSDWIGPVGRVSLAQGTGVVAAVPLGRLTPPALAGVAAIAAGSGAGLRLTPWRSILVHGLEAADIEPTRVALDRLGLCTRPDDPAIGVVCCSGAGGCWSTELDTVRLATDLATTRPVGAPIGTIVHVSGCAKSCAHHGPAAVTLTGRDDASGFDLHSESHQ